MGPLSLPALATKRTNHLRNSVADNGAVVGVIGAGGALPSNWTQSAVTGLTYEVTGTGVGSNGEPYIDVKISGTNGTGGSVFPQIQFESSVAVQAMSGELWAASHWVGIAAGSLTGVTGGTLNTNIVETTAAGGYVANGTVAFAPTGTVARYEGSRLLSGGGTVARCYSAISFSVANTATIDLTLRIGAPQLEREPRATAYIRTVTVAVTRYQ